MLLAFWSNLSKSKCVWFKKRNDIWWRVIYIPCFHVSKVHAMLLTRIFKRQIWLIPVDDFKWSCIFAGFILTYLFLREFEIGSVSLCHVVSNQQRIWRRWLMERNWDNSLMWSNHGPDIELNQCQVTPTNIWSPCFSTKMMKRKHVSATKKILLWITKNLWIYRA